uniref:MARCKS-related protein n=1 Tax=Rattus norvegicus TaxID=10116 RepID=A0A8I6AFB9_RAT
SLSYWGNKRKQLYAQEKRSRPNQGLWDSNWPTWSKEGTGKGPRSSNGENGHVKSNGDLTPKGEGESPPVNGADEAAGATGDAIEPAPPSQEAEAKGEVAPKETPKKKKKFSFKKPFKLSGLSFKRNRKEGGGDSSASSPTEEEQEQGEISACSDEGTAQEGKAAATPESQEPQAKGAEASAVSKGGDAEEEAGPQAAEPSTPSGPESGPASASAENE